MTTSFVPTQNINMRSFSYDFSDKKTTKTMPLITTILISASMLIPNLTLNATPSIKHIRYSANEKKHSNFISINNNDTIKVDIDEAGGVSMSNLSHKDILESERVVNEKIEDVRTSLKTDFTNGLENTHTKIDRINSNIDTTHTKIDKLHEEIITINKQLVSINADIKNLPDKLNASKWETLWKHILLPIGITVVTTFILIKFGLKK
ncbi:hypothetical protein [Enterococcus faecalis]|uniref:hypothetical protein n=1 Tax=Enterococcus faecalis TaxID=1351 RepID=UPI0034D0133B